MDRKPSQFNVCHLKMIAVIRFKGNPIMSISKHHLFVALPTSLPNCRLQEMSYNERKIELQNKIAKGGLTLNQSNEAKPLLSCLHLYRFGIFEVLIFQTNFHFPLRFEKAGLQCTNFWNKDFIDKDVENIVLWFAQPKQNPNKSPGKSKILV